MKLFFSIFLILTSFFATIKTIEVSVPKKWSCNDAENCVPYVGQKSLESPSIYESQNICRISCGRYGSLWPRPTGNVIISQGRVNFSPNRIKVDVYAVSNEAASFLDGARDLFLENVRKECKYECDKPTDHALVVQIRVADGKLNLDWSTDESSVLVISTTGDISYADIQAATVYGARHALESLSQLITSSTESSQCPPIVVNVIEIVPPPPPPPPTPHTTVSTVTINYNVDIMIRNKRRGIYQAIRARPCFRSGLVMVSSARIVDKPTFSHRGVLIDTARNFIPVDVIKRSLDAMATSKLNVFHWHATDSQSFPLEIPQVPQLQRFGAYSAEMTYSVKEMEDIIKYANQRGIRVIIEIDSPAHAGNGWQWGPLGGLGDLAVCVNQQPWRSLCIQPPCGQMNPVNENLYGILKMVYEDLAKLQPNEYTMHLGGDELHLGCWNSSTEIISKLRERGLSPTVDSFHLLWSEFHQRTQRIWSHIKQRESKAILWSSGLTNPLTIERNLPADKFIIHTWVPSDESLVRDLLLRGYQLIVTPKDGWYLDHGFWGVTTYYNWRKVYDKIVPRDPNILGGEVCMWSEYVDGNGVESRIWPRAGAAAERLWADPNTPSHVAESRFNRYRERLITRGIGPDAVTPQWCVLNEGECK